MARRNVKVGNISKVHGEINIAGRDIVKNIKTIYQRALTAAEEAARGRKIEGKLLAQGISLLAQNLSTQASQSTEGDSPYKGLLAYNLNEAEIFFGRNDAKKALLRCIKQDSLTILHAESGAGKSSLLQAGIAAQLIANGHLAIHLRSHNADPVDFIKRAFLPELSQAPALAKASLREFLRQVCAILGTKVNLYLLLDQFEEFFSLLTIDERKSFLKSLADCLNDSGLKVRWILAMRAEALSDLAELESFGVAPFKNMYRLNRLSRTEAQAAIIEPAQRYDISFERALINHILDTLTTNKGVTPTHLQLVCSALTDELPEDKTLTLTYYTDFEGGTEGILRDYLKRQLEHLPAEEQEPAWKLLRTLITSDRLRAVKTRDEIVAELKLGGMSGEQIDTLLARLVERRLLTTQPTTTEIFELAHDYLVKEIELDPQEQARKAAQELLDQETRTYQRHKSLLTAERLAVIEPHQNELHFSDEARKLLIESQKAILTGKRRRSTILVGISVVAVVVAIAMTTLWLNAQKQADIALARQLVAQAETINRTRNSEQMTAVLLAIRSMQLFPTLEGSQILQNYALVQPILSLGLEDKVKAIAFSPDGNHVVTASYYADTISVWETITGEEITHMTQNAVNSIAFSPDGKYVVSGSYDGTVYIWETFTGIEIAQMMAHEEYVKSVAFSPNGKYVVSGGCEKDLDCQQGTARVWEASTGKEIARMTYEGEVNSIAFSLDGKFVVSGGCENEGVETESICGASTARVWEAATGKEIARVTHDDGVNSIAFSLDSEYVVSGGWDETVSVWEATTGKEIARMTHDIGVTMVAFSADGKYVISGGLDKTARVWEVSTGKEIAHTTHDDFVQSVTFSPDSKYVVSGSNDGTARIWEVTTGKEIARMTHDDTVDFVAVSSDGKYVVSKDQAGIAFVWETTPKQFAATELSNKPHARIECKKYSPANSTTNSDCVQAFVAMNDPSTGTQTWGISITGPVLGVEYSPDGKYLASTDGKNAIYIWETATGREITHMTHEKEVLVIAFSPDGKYVASGSRDGTARIWETTTGKEIYRISYDDLVDELEFSPDGRYIVFAGYYGKTARVWGMTTGKEVARMAHNDGVVSVAFSPDSNYVVSGSRDKTVSLWDVTTGKEVAHMTYDNDFDYRVVFSPDGKYVQSPDKELVWVWRAEDLIAEACSRVRRNLNPEEWKLYLDDKPYQAICPNLPIEPESTPTPTRKPIRLTPSS